MTTTDVFELAVVGWRYSFADEDSEEFDTRRDAVRELSTRHGIDRGYAALFVWPVLVPTLADERRAA